MTIIEIIAACILLSFVMIATFLFISFASTSTDITVQNSSVHNEMKSMLLHIKREVVGSIRADILNSSNPIGPLNADEVLFRNDGNRFSITKGSGDDIFFLEGFNPIVTFDVVGSNFDILRVSISNSNTDPKYRFEMTDDIFLANLRFATEIDSLLPTSIGGGPGDVLLIKIQN